jgi:hypothetical protein
LYRKQPRRHELSKNKNINKGFEIDPGDSVLVIGSDGKLKKLVVSGLNQRNPHTEGTKKVFEILQIFDPTAKVETFENADKRKIN